MEALEFVFNHHPKDSLAGVQEPHFEKQYLQMCFLEDCKCKFYVALEFEGVREMRSLVLSEQMMKKVLHSSKVRVTCLLLLYDRTTRHPENLRHSTHYVNKYLLCHQKKAILKASVPFSLKESSNTINQLIHLSP